MTRDWERTPSGKKRARAIGVPFEGAPGPFNAITDVAGVEVGYTTLIRGEGPLVIGEGPVRTGVTAILPRGRDGVTTPVMAGSFSLNGNGELTGTIWIEESGQCEGPITLTNTHSCGVARDATIRWLVRHRPEVMNAWGLPVAGETFDGELNDINGFHVTAEHVFAAIDGARGGALELGSVGGGTGMICYDFKGGSGSASRLVEVAGSGYCVGAFVQANFGARRELVVAGVPVGRSLPGGELRGKPGGSIIAVVGTDAPLLSHQLKRLARRISLGLARSGSVSHNGSGDIFLAFSTANAAVFAGSGYCVGAFVQANFGARRELVVAGVPVGRSLPGGELRGKPGGSIIAVVGTDAPLLPHQLKRLARRISLGLARSGSVSHNGSGDIFLAFSTANAAAFAGGAGRLTADFLANDRLDLLFEAVVQATDEAIIDSMVANETMVGRDGTTARALPHEDLVALLRAHQRLAPA